MVSALKLLLTKDRLKTVGIFIISIAAVWFYLSWEFRGYEMKRQQENMSQIRKYDSLKFASQTLNTQELEEYLEYNRKELQEFIRDNRISTSKIKQIISQEFKYRDTVTKNQDLSPILEAIKERRPLAVPVVDSSKCLIIKGWVVFKNDSLSLNISDRKFTNFSDVVSHFRRRKWKTPFGFSTRLFGRREVEIITRDDCGNTKTMIITKE